MPERLSEKAWRAAALLDEVAKATTFDDYRATAEELTSQIGSLASLLEDEEQEEDDRA